MSEINRTKLNLMYPTKEAREALICFAQDPDVSKFAYEKYTNEIEVLESKKERLDKQIDDWYEKNWKSANIWKREKEIEKVKSLYLGFIDYELDIIERLIIKFRPIAKNKGAGWVEKDEIDRANETPIDSLMEFNRADKALCLWHDEDTPSLSYKRSQNYVKCFGQCGTAHGAIDVYQKLNNCDFVTAVNALND